MTQRRGIKVSFRRWDPKLGRSRCGDCNRPLITGQARCVCGATFHGILSQP